MLLVLVPLLLGISVHNEVLRTRDLNGIGLAISGLTERLRHPRQRDTLAVPLKALTEMLPQLQMSDADLLTLRQYRQLLWLLKNAEVRLGALKSAESELRHYFWTPVPLITGILKALEQIGDMEAIPLVETLANSMGQDDETQAIREAAQACLPLLRERATRQGTSAILLRPSQPTAALPDILLRPASAEANRDEPQHLLRATANAAEERTP